MKLDQRLRLAVDYLLSLSPQQLANAAEYKDAACMHKLREVQVTFPVSLALHAVSYLPLSYQGPDVQRWIDAVIDYLSAQGAADNSFNYWTRESPLFVGQPLPDDLDDTACACSALLRNGADVMENYLLKVLELESKVGGPYLTWYVDNANEANARWYDIDPAVNAHFLYLAEAYGIDLPQTLSYLQQQISSNQIKSQYYPYTLNFWLYFCRYVAVNSDENLVRFAQGYLREYDYNTLSPLEKLLWCLCASYLRMDLSEARITELASWQRADGSLPAVPMCHGFPEKIGDPSYTGNAAVATALFVEVISMQLRGQDISISSNRAEDNKVTQFSQALKQQIAKDYQQLPVAAKLTEFFPVDNDQQYKSLRLPLLVAQTVNSHLSPTELVRISDLSLAMFYAWCAYTLMDNILDGQTSSGAQPCVNSLLRLSDSYLQQLAGGYPSVVRQIQLALNECDEHYLWEAEVARFGDEIPSREILVTMDTSYITRRMHPFLVAISTVPLLMDKPQAAAVDQLYKFFTAVVKIDQLNDDAHDYRQDLGSGVLTFVVAKLLLTGAKSTDVGKVFWSDVAPLVFSECTESLESAEECLQQITKQGYDVKQLSHLLQNSYKPILQAEKELTKLRKILRSYSE